MTATGPGGPRYFVFLRAINVGGRRLSNVELLAPFRDLGLEDVAAYQAAGNVTYRTSGGGAPEPDRIEAAFEKAHGFRSRVFVRTDDAVQAILSAEPFSHGELAATTGRIQVAFMQNAPGSDLVSDVMALVPDDESSCLLGVAVVLATAPGNQRLTTSSCGDRGDRRADDITHARHRLPNVHQVRLMPRALQRVNSPQPAV